jgi:membrane peptidoglycan carboxypeptidase
MERVVAGERGTARRLGSLPVRLAGKTGTSQVMRKKEGVKWFELPWEQRHHALFVGYAPVDDPQLLVCVVVEHGGDAASVAAPIAARIIQRAFGPRVGEGQVTATVPPIWQNTSLPPPPVPAGEPGAPTAVEPSTAALEPARPANRAEVRPQPHHGTALQAPPTRQ